MSRRCGYRQRQEHQGDKAPKPTRIDLQGLADRFVPIPVAERNYDNLIVASTARCSISRAASPGRPRSRQDLDGGDGELYRYSFEDRTEKRSNRAWSMCRQARITRSFC